MNWVDKLTASSEPATQVRKTAIIMAAFAWLAGVVCCLIGGLATLPAVAEATLATGGGLTAWWLYRQTSGRYDGLAIIMVAVVGPCGHILDGPFTGFVATACIVVVQIKIAPIVGLCVRGYPTKVGRQQRRTSLDSVTSEL